MTEHDLLELIEGQFVHAEADEVVEDGEEGGVVLAVGGGGEEGEDGVVGSLEEGAVSFAAIEDLPHEDPLRVFALYASEELLGMRVRSHYLLVEAVDQLDAFLDQLGVFHPFVT